MMPQLKSRLTRGERHQAEKTAFHHVNAGTGAELLKIRQAKVFNALRKKYAMADVRVALQMHDEIILECRTNIVPEVRELALAKFNEPTPGFLPFSVDCRLGRNWMETSK